MPRTRSKNPRTVVKTETKSLPAASIKKLEEYRQEISIIIKQTVEGAVRIGEILLDIKTNILPEGQWQQWIDKHFEGQLHHDSANNFINAALFVRKYKDQYSEGISNLSLSALYKISTSSVDESLQRTILELSEEDEPPTRDELETIKRVYRKSQLALAGVAPEIAEQVISSSLAENPVELKRFSQLSKRKQDKVAKLIGAGTADSVKDALQTLRPVEVTVDSAAEIVSNVFSYKSLDDFNSIPDDSISVALVEAPLSFEYLDEYASIATNLNRVLMPGGFAILTIGHKAAMYIGKELEPLIPLHILCIRRQPGRTRSLLGANILSASVLCAFAYKSPYQPPKRMVADVQTISTPTDSEALEGFDEVISGIENAFTAFLNSLLKPASNFLYCELSRQSFGLIETLKACAEENQVATLFHLKTKV